MMSQKFKVLLVLVALLMWESAVCAQEVQITADGQYEYVINADGLTATIVGYCGPGGEVSLPWEFDGLLVTSLGEASFFNKGLMGELTIPTGVRRIELDAFNANHGLTRVNIPASVDFIHPDAFTYCDGVNDVYLYHIYPDLTSPPLYHGLDWADPTAASFAGPGVTILHVMDGTVDAHMEGAVPSNNVAVRKWMEQNPASVVDDIALPNSFQFAIDETGFGVVYRATGWVVPEGVTACAVVWDDISTSPRDGAEDEEIDTPSQLMHYGWDASRPWVIDLATVQHKYAAGETVPKGCGVIVTGNEGTYTAAFDYDAGLVPFRNLLHGRDFPSVTDFPSLDTDDVVSVYRFGRLRGGAGYGFLWEKYIVHGTSQDQWKQDDGKPFVAEGGEPWLALTSDPGEGTLSLPQDAHFFITVINSENTGLEKINSADCPDGRWTDLTGRQYTRRPTAAGIYIHNGKKIIIK